MAKTQKTHIKQSYFKRLRKWFTRQARKLSCIAKVEPEDGDGAAVAESADGIGEPITTGNSHADVQNMFTRTANYEIKECRCGGYVEHPAVASSSATTVLDDISPRGSRSAPVLAGTPDECCSGLPDCRTSLLGSFHQGNIPARWNPSKYEGTQCTSTSYTAIAASGILPPGLWSQNTIDLVVRKGVKLHQNLIEQLAGSVPRSHYLAADEMPTIPEDGINIWPLECSSCQEFQGLLYPKPMDPVSLKNQLTWQLYPGQPLRDLGDALERSFQQKAQGCIITLGDRSSAVFKNPVGGYMVFDSHGKNILGYPDSDGKASLLRFASQDQLLTYFRSMTSSQTMFSLTGFRVELKD